MTTHGPGTARSLARPSSRALAALTGLLSLLAAACNDASPIVVDPADQINVLVVDPLGAPLRSVNLGYYKIAFKLDTALTTPPTPYSLPGEFQEASSMQSTDSSGRTAFYMPRHGVLNTGAVVAVEQPWGRMYSFVLTQEVTVDLFTTVFYELIAHSTVAPMNFSVPKLLMLQDSARASILKAIANHWIDPSAPMEKLHRAFQNALAADSKFMQLLAQTALEINPALNLYGYVPYQDFNTFAKISGISPSQQRPLVVETNSLDLQVSGTDKEHDTVFYSWVASATPLTLSTLKNGQLLKIETGANSTSKIGYVSDYATNLWYQDLSTMYVYAVVSDGGSPAMQGWEVSVQNKPRPPEFTSAPPVTGTEQAEWTYTPVARSPDGAPFRMALTAPSPASARMCVPSSIYLADPPDGMSALATPPTWSWKDAAGNGYGGCSTPYLIKWTPSNCEAGPVLSPVQITVQAVDAKNATSSQLISVRVADVNAPPVITSSAPNLVIAGPTPWSYSPLISDAQAVAGPAVNGAHGCGDTFVYSLLRAPVGTSIDPVTGAIDWTPAGTDTGDNEFLLEISDSHGGKANQSWTVRVDNVNTAPVLDSTYCSPVAHMKDPLEITIPPILPYRYRCFVTWSQWTLNSLYTASITGLPGNVVQTFPANMQTVPFPETNGATGNKNGVGFTLNPSDADTVAQPAVRTYPISIQLCNDGAGGAFAPLCSTYSYNLQVPREDIKPSFATLPSPIVNGGCLAADCATVGPSHYTYSAQVEDKNSAVSPIDTFVFTLTQPSPAGAYPMTMTVGSSTAPLGTFSLDWQVNNTTDLGVHNVSVSARSGIAANGGPYTEPQSWTVFVQETNYIPSFSAIPAQTGTNGTPYTLNAKNYCSTSATTIPNKNLTFSLGAGSPTGMTIDSKTGVVKWTPTSAQARGPQPLSYSVKCESKLGTPATSAVASIPVNLTWINLAPQFATVPSRIIAVGQTISVPIQASDPDGDAITVTATGVPLTAAFTSGGGDGLLSWTPTIFDVGTYNLTFTASDGLMTSTMPLQLQVVNNPVVLSHPVSRATATYPYHYEIHALDPVGQGLTFSVRGSPSGVQVERLVSDPTAALVTWTPGLSFAGDQVINIDIADGDGNTITHSFHVNVGTGASGAPVINGTLPSGDPVIATEGTNQAYSAQATDPDADTLHYSYLWDGEWVADGTPSYSFAPPADQAGNHVLTIRVTDGASADVTAHMNVHVRDAIPQMGGRFLFMDPLTNLLANPRSGQLYAVTSGAGASMLHQFSSSALEAGPTHSDALPIPVQRLTLKNNFTAAGDFVLYFASDMNATAAVNSFGSLDSTGMLNTCPGTTCFQPTFIQNAQFSGGTQSAYNPNTAVGYYIKPSNRRYLGTYAAGVAGADIDLGAGVSANAMVLDTVTNRIFVAAGGTHRVIVLNAANSAVLGSIAGVGVNPAALVLNPAAGKLYVYSPVSGSVTEILTSAMTANGSRTGFPTSGMIGAEPRNVMGINTQDDVIYLAVPDTHQLVVYDAASGAIRSITLGSGPDEVAVDAAHGKVFVGSFVGREITQLR